MALILSSAVVSPVSRMVKRSVSLVSGFFAVNNNPIAIKGRVFDDLRDLSVTHALEFARIVEFQVMRSPQ